MLHNLRVTWVTWAYICEIICSSVHVVCELEIKWSIVNVVVWQTGGKCVSLLLVAYWFLFVTHHHRASQMSCKNTIWTDWPVDNNIRRMWDVVEEQQTFKRHLNLTPTNLNKNRVSFTLAASLQFDSESNWLLSLSEWFTRSFALLLARFFMSYR